MFFNRAKTNLETEIDQQIFNLNEILLKPDTEKRIQDELMVLIVAKSFLKGDADMAHLEGAMREHSLWNISPDSPTKSIVDAVIATVKMKVVRTETLDVLLQKYPAEQWWRLFIDGYRQYSLINRERTLFEISIPNYKEQLVPACASFENGEIGYMELSLFTFFSLLEHLDAPLTVTMIKDIHSRATTGISIIANETLDHQFNPGNFRDENSNMGYVLIKPYQKYVSPTITENGLMELKSQEELLGIKYRSGPNTDTMVYPVPCKSYIVENKINEIISAYELKVVNEPDAYTKIRIIADTIQKLERLHPFNDGNCRTFCMHILNKELLRHNMYPTILRDPNTFDAFSLDEMVQEIISGQMRFKEILKFATCENEADRQNATLSFKSKIYPDLVQYLHKNTPLPIRLNDEEHAKIMEIMGKSLARIPDDHAMSAIVKKQLTPAATSPPGKRK